MFQGEGQDPAEKTVGEHQNTYLIPVFVCAFLSVLFSNIGLLSMFYLVPLGYAILACNSLKFPFFITALANVFFYLVFKQKNNAPLMWMEIFHLTVVLLCFSWIMNGGEFPQIRTAYRFIISCCVGAVALLVSFFVLSSTAEFQLILEETLQAVSSAISPSVEDDIAMNPFLQKMLTVQGMLELTKNILLRGGALASVFFLFYINRLLSLASFWIVKKQKRDNGLAAFFAPVNTIWVFSGAIATILLSRTFDVVFLEIMAWNVFVVCAILFLAQGAGILRFLLARRTPGMRIFVNILIIFVLFISPLNAVAVAALLLLGIVENWLPFRQPKQRSFV